MLQKLRVSNFECIKDTSQYNEDSNKSCNKESDEWYFIKVDVQYLEKLHETHNDLAFLPERMKIKKVKKLVANLHDKTEYAIHIRNSRQALHQGLVLEKVHRVINKNEQTVYLGLSILESSKIIMHEFWYDYVKPKYGEKVCAVWVQTGSLCT